MNFALTMFKASPKASFISWAKALMLTFRIIAGGIGKNVTRAQAAQYILDYSKI